VFPNSISFSLDPYRKTDHIKMETRQGQRCRKKIELIKWALPSELSSMCIDFLPVREVYGVLNTVCSLFNQIVRDSPIIAQQITFCSNTYRSKQLVNKITQVRYISIMPRLNCFKNLHTLTLDKVTIDTNKPWCPPPGLKTLNLKSVLLATGTTLFGKQTQLQYIHIDSLLCEPGHRDVENTCLNLEHCTKTLLELSITRSCACHFVKASEVFQCASLQHIRAPIHIDTFLDPTEHSMVDLQTLMFLSGSNNLIMRQADMLAYIAPNLISLYHQDLHMSDLSFLTRLKRLQHLSIVVATDYLARMMCPISMRYGLIACDNITFYQRIHQ
jgi:hypothetical protein